MSTLLPPPFITALDGNGDPISGATLTFYLTGTSTLTPVFSDALLTTPLPNPVVANAAGRFPAIFLDPDVTYRAVMKDAGGSDIPGSDIDPVASTIDGNSISVIQAGGGAVARTLQSKLREVVSVTDFGAVGDGVTLATAAFSAAAAQAVAVQAPLVVPGGVFVIDNWTPPAGLTLVGEGGTLRRRAAAPNNNTMVILANSNITLRNLVIDGNKANNTLAANSVVVTGGGNYTIEGVQLINAKRVSGGFGSGVVVAATNDQTAGTQTTIRNCTVSGNDADGILLDECWNVAILDNECSSNGGSGIALANYDTPIEAQSQRNITIAGNFCTNNTDSGIVVVGTTPSNVLPPVTDYQAIKITIEGNQCVDNTKYGIAAQGTSIGVWDNACSANGNDGGARITFGGILFNAYLSACEGNIVGGNEFYGIDAGGAFGSVISDNVVNFNGNAAGNGTGINIGAAVNTVVRGNSLLNNGGQAAAIGSQIYCPAYDSNGTTTGGLPYRAVGNLIEDNFMELTAVTQSGVFLSQGPQEMVVRNNTVRGGAADKAFIVETDSARISGNVHTPNIGGLAVASAATMVVTDWAEELVVSGTTTITNLRTTSQDANFQRVAWVVVTNSGSAYTTPPTVVFTGGGGTGAAAQAYIGDDGKVRGILMTAKGSGYTSAPTISFTGGGGTGATATAVVGCNNRIGRRITMVFAGNAPVANAGSTFLAGAATYTPGASGSSTLSLLGMYGTNWHEIGRSIA